MRVYFDNAATTPLDPEVFETMKPFFTDYYGNPSSIHSHGREVRSAIEKSRKKIADLLNCSPSEIFFTSGGTEADNCFLCSTIRSHKINHIITSPIEHHAVLHTVEHLKEQNKVKVSYVNLDDKGHIDMDHLKTLLEKNPQSLVTIMHANNEIGNISDIGAIADLCADFNAVFHSDTVQSMGYIKHDLQNIKAHSIVGSAHKFHGPKGIGFIYIRNDFYIKPLIYGGGQERNMRGGTENVYSIIGMAKALDIAYRDMQKHQNHIQEIKSYMISQLKTIIPGVTFNGDSEDPDKSLFKVLNASLPESDDNEMLLFNLDINQVSASGGSACSSGSNIGSHVLKALNTDPNRGAIRFSFSKFNTKKEVDFVIKQLASIYQVTA